MRQSMRSRGVSKKGSGAGTRLHTVGVFFVIGGAAGADGCHSLSVGQQYADVIVSALLDMSVILIVC